MRLRTITRAAAAVIVLGLAACGSEQGGTPVAAGDATAALGGSSAPGGPGTGVPSSIPDLPGMTPSASTDQSDPSDPAGSSESAPPGSEPTEATGSGEPSGSGESSGSEPIASPGGTSGPSADSSATDPATPDSSSASPGATEGPGSTDTSGDTVPKDLCQLMPADLSKGLEKDNGNTELACLYYANVDHNYVSVQVYTSTTPVDPEDPDGSGLAEKFEHPTVDGRQAHSWFSEPQKSATVAFDAGEGSIYLSYMNEGTSAAENMKVAESFAERVSKGLRNGGTIDGAAKPPPSTTPATIPEGERGWPGRICDLMPAELMQEMTSAKGNENERCRLESDTDTGFTHITVRKAYSLDPEDPSRGVSDDVQEESFDGRTAYSWLDGDDVPHATVVFDTGERSSAAVEYSIADVEKPVDPEKVRTAAIDLAGKIAPKLPQP